LDCLDWHPFEINRLEYLQMKINPGKHLEAIQFPSDLRKTDEAELHLVCEDLRQYIVDTVSVYGGHFGASLGVVELTVALHYVFDTPNDQVVFDVGHQAYGHKILTGRRDVFHTNRVFGGISGFPKRKESEYDAFGVGHSSTSISAALGMAVAAGLNGEKDKQVVAVIGDGGFQMTIQELGTLFQTGANVKILILNNEFLGMVRQWQELFFEKRYSFTEMSNPNFVQIAKGYGISGKTVRERADLESAVAEMLQHKASYLLEVMVGKEDNVFPMVPTGASVSEVKLGPE
jgi:TPP-dependent 2-oxoacid decarboxylase